MANTCYKLSYLVNPIKDLNEIKNIINSLTEERREKDEKYFKDFDKNFKVLKNKYNIIHNKLYNIIFVVMTSECCLSEKLCEVGKIGCLSEKDNNLVYSEMRKLRSKIYRFYDEVETKLVAEFNLCLFKNKINYLLA